MTYENPLDYLKSKLERLKKENGQWMDQVKGRQNDIEEIHKTIIKNNAQIKEYEEFISKMESL